VYYSLAKAQSSGAGSCDSTAGKNVGSSCVFYDTTQGDIDVSCTGKDNCFLPSGMNGVLSTSGIAFEPAYASGAGWDFSTGLGSVNAFNLVSRWPSAPASESGQ
jgi:hypothetical protein